MHGFYLHKNLFFGKVSRLVYVALLSFIHYELQLSTENNSQSLQKHKHVTSRWLLSAIVITVAVIRNSINLDENKVA